jgi:lysophospholipase L1-like esterase
MVRRQFLIGMGATLVTAGLTEACGGSPTSPSGNPPPQPNPNPQPPPPAPTPATLRISRILAFGDSLTAGTVQPPFGLLSIDAGRSESYPFKMQTLMAARYSGQTVSVFNAGFAGKNAWEDRSRLASSIADTSPELVILMEGANDLNSINPPSTNAQIDSTVGHMEDMVRDTIARGIPIILATLPPQREGGARAHGVPYLAKYNSDLKTMASKKGASLVDVNAQFPLALIGQDGLHPTEPGYQTLADIMFDAIKSRYEVTTPTE